MSLFGAKRSKIGIEKLGENGFERHHSKVPPKALENSTPTNGGYDFVKRGSYQILDLGLICIDFYANR